MIARCVLAAALALGQVQTPDPVVLLTQAKQFFDVRNPLGAVKVGGDHGQEVTRRNCETQQLRDAIAIAALNQRIQEHRRPLEVVMFLPGDELNFAMTAQRVEQPAPVQFLRVNLLTGIRSATQCQQRVV